jgi:hypothetical protein
LVGETEWFGGGEDDGKEMKNWCRGGVSVTNAVFSSDGQTLSGLVVRQRAAGGADPSLYMLTVPGPGGIGLVDAGVLAARRRR